MHAPLSAQQKNIWYIEQIHPNTSIGIIAASGKIKGRIDYFLLQQAINAYIESDENIRTHITLVDGEPRQYIADYKPKQIDYFDFSITQKEGLYQWDTALTQQPFTLLDSDLFYFAIYKINENEGGFLVKTHHIISDGWSTVLIGNHLMDNYNRLLNGEKLQKIQTPLYQDFIERQKKYLVSPRYETDRQYWADIVGKIPDQLGLKEYNLSNFSTVAKRKAYIIPEKIVNRIKYLCDEYRASTFSLLFSILSLYIYRITGRTRFSFGTPVINRQDAVEKNTVGMFINTVPIIIDINEEMSFIEFNKYIIREWLQVLRHQQYPYDKIVEEARKHNGSINKLFDIVISYQNAKLVKGENFADRMEGRWHFNGHQTQSLFIHISERENDGRILLDYDYLAQIFTSKEIEYIHNHFINLLSDAIEHPEKRLFEVDLLDADEKFRVLKAFNQTDLDHDRTKLIHQLIEEQAEANPERIAVISGDEKLTYGALNDKASRLAAHLLSQGLQDQGVAAIAAKRSPMLVVAMLAVLKAGGAFLPMDPGLPDERISAILRQSEAAFLLAGKEDCGFSEPRVKRIDLEDSSIFDSTDAASEGNDSKVTPDSLAYVIYTSGSTGEPKGVMIEHRSLVNFNAAMLNCMDYVPGTGVLSLASAGFDVFIFETLPTLMNGLKLVLAGEKAQREPSLIAGLIENNDVRKLYVTPSRLRTLLLDERCKSALARLTEVVCGGEEFSPDLVASAKKATNALLFNQYGPTEATIGVTIKHIESAGAVNIGKPMANTKIYILDAHRNPLPIGVPGEMYIGGECLARGYMGNKQQTEESFVQSPFDASEKLYKTGDMARWYPRGEIAFLGRTDEQVKIRGYRIELKEIENCIKKYDPVENAVVKDHEDSHGNRFLCAYIVSRQDLSKELRQFLMQQLPHYMLPAFYLRLESIPLTANGKVDYSGLPKPDLSTEGRTAYAAPSNSIENALIGIWQKVLQLDIIGVQDNYFQLGGDSLNAMMMIAEVHRTFNVNLLFTDVYESPTIRQLARTIADARQSGFAAMQRAPHMAQYPLSAAQKRLYVLGMMEQNKTAYNMPGAFRVTGKLDIEHLEKALRTLVDRHDVFRTNFMIENGQAVQFIHEENGFKLEILNQKTTVDEALRDFVRPFDLSRDTLMRAGILQISADEHILLIDMHHIISDGASSAILMEELNTIYSGGILGNPGFQYKDYVLWAEELARNPLMKKQEAYWINQFIDPPLLNLPTDRQRGEISDFKGHKLRFGFDKTTSGTIAEFCRHRNVSLFMFFLTNWYLLLSRMSGQSDIVIGTPSQGRRHADLVNIIGAFINILPIRCRSNPDMTFSELLNEIKGLTITALDNQDYPFDELVEKLNLPRDLSRNPLFDTMFVMQTVDAHQMKLGGLDIEPMEIDTGITKFDMTLEATAYEETISCSLEYSSRLFDRQTVERYAKHFTSLVAGSITHADSILGSIECMDAAEKHLLLHAYNDTLQVYDPTPVDLLFDEHAKNNPSKAALVFHNREISFGRLKEMADGIAWMLQKEGIGPGSVVGLLFHRGIEMMACVWGILKAGASYMPIDPEYPEERIQYMLGISNTGLLLAGEGTGPIGFPGKTIYIHEDTIPYAKPAAFNRSPEDSIYVLFTSGSTGRPKGVMITHRSVHNLINSICKLIPYSPDDIFLCSSTLYFDAFVLVALIPLAKGMKVILADEEELMLPWRMAELIDREKISSVFFTPSRMRVLLNDKSFRESMKEIKYLMVGGEALPAGLAGQIMALTPVRLYNLYGPTEITVCATATEILENSDITIGKAISNTQVYVLDEKLNLLPQGAVGELFVGGDGVAKGYINREELTKESFLPNPFKDGQRTMYRTGDLVRYNNDGELVYFGRRDGQIKIRGLRIETEEIESQILMSGNALQAFVAPVTQEDQSTALCAYIVLNKDGELSSVKSYISGKLPAYMLPAYYCIMDSLPLNASGKIDRKSLPAPARPENDLKADTMGGYPETVKAFCTVWSEILKRDVIDPRKSFFEQGGDSLSAIIVQTRYHEKGWDISTRDFFHFPTVMEHIKLITEQGETSTCLRNDPYPARIPESPPYPAARLRNILLTGPTGYLGAHILKEMLENTPATLWCLVRGDEPAKRLQTYTDWYHGEEYLAAYASRVKVVQGDISMQNFGLPRSEYSALVQTIDTVIHTAAMVKHYGDPSVFESVNITGTGRIVEFTKESNAHLLHISTTSIAADNGGKDGAFTENDFYVGQDYLINDYVASKFKAEALVLKAISDGCNAAILRVGNLTGRYSDGRFQKNIGDNAFYQYMRAFVAANKAPEDYRDMQLEFTPVDLCARAVRLLIPAEDLAGRCFHLSNPNRILLEQLVDLWDLKADGFTWKKEGDLLTDDAAVRTDERLAYLSDFIYSGHASKAKSVVISTESTDARLYERGFVWPRPDRAYLWKIREHMAAAGFLDENKLAKEHKR